MSWLHFVMAYEKMEFRAFDTATLKASREAWLSDAADGLAFYSEVERLFDWATTHCELSPTDATAFGVFRDGKKQALGLCEIIVQRKSARSKWVKMLRLHLRPSVDADLQGGNSTAAMNVFGSSLQGSLDLQMAHKATTLKVYGRTNEQLTFLRALVSHIEQNLSSAVKEAAKVSIDGRFLSIEVK
jgi:hypothetical protein